MQGKNGSVERKGDALTVVMGSKMSVINVGDLNSFDPYDRRRETMLWIHGRDESRVAEFRLVFPSEMADEVRSMASDVKARRAQLREQSEPIDTRGVVERAVSESPPLPLAGVWEYKVVRMSELGGFATAKGTATRMDDTLNRLAADGWELVTTSERDNRWTVGESVILTLRRYVTTEVMYAARFEAEERIRRQVLASLNTQLLPRPQIA